jgi:hypothetical protein
MELHELYGESVVAVNALMNTLQIAILVALLRWVYGHRSGSIREREDDRSAVRRR